MLVKSNTGANADKKRQTSGIAKAGVDVAVTLGLLVTTLPRWGDAAASA